MALSFRNVPELIKTCHSLSHFHTALLKRAHIKILKPKLVYVTNNSVSLSVTCILWKISLSHRLLFLMIPLRSSASFLLEAKSSSHRFSVVLACAKI